MATRFFIHGDMEYGNQLRHEGSRQLEILKRAMEFQGLKQLKRIARYSDGSEIVCYSGFGVDNVHISSKSYHESPPKLVEFYFCWCNACFSHGVIKEVIDYDEIFGPFWRSDIGGSGTPGAFYPTYCKTLIMYGLALQDDAEIRRYTGVRYRVSICQGILGMDQEIICCPSDFAQYEVGEDVIVLYLGRWENKTVEQNRTPPIYLDQFASCQCVEVDGQAILCEACQATLRGDWLDNQADGSFILMPIRVAGVNK